MKHNFTKNMEQKARYLIQIGRLLEQGYPLDKAISFVQLHVPSQIKREFEQVLKSLKEGHNIHESFSITDLPQLYLSFLYFYERQGKLAEGFIHAGQLLEKRETMKHEFMKLLRYPLFLLWLCFFLFIVMYSLVLPHFQSFFTLVKDVPPMTRAVYTMMERIPYMTVVFCFIVISTAVYYSFKMKSLPLTEKVHRLVSLPYVGRYIRTLLTYYLSLQLGRLLDVGLSLKEALQLFSNQMYVPFFQHECKKIMNELHEGIMFSQLLQKRNYFKEDFSVVAKHGEKTGYLAKDLIHYSDMLYRELDEMMLKLLKYVQPICFLFIGGVVFLLFLATMLPLFQMIGAL